MTQNENYLWSLIEAFNINGNNAHLTFERRLARENGWGTKYTHRVIEEYKKFIFLCCVGETALTPSDPVD